ncbi:lectin [Streptomyces sp. NPDC050625]|uniref:lectin n=1 Tax=Streptomyces sp. NPDC050625 TaxID=3154629 RepID=UPI003445CD06
MLDLITSNQERRVGRTIGAILAGAGLVPLAACSSLSTPEAKGPANTPAEKSNSDYVQLDVSAALPSAPSAQTATASPSQPAIAPQAQTTTGAITGLAGKCLDTARASSADGTPVQLYDCNGTTAQQWTIGSDGTIRALGKCLDVTDDSTGDGAKVQLWTCTGGANQKWTVNAAQDIVNPRADKCLDVTDYQSADGAPAQIWTCTGGANQKWTVNAAQDIVNPQADKCLDVTDYQSADGAPAQRWSCSGGTDQNWNAVHAEQKTNTCWATHYGPEPSGALTANGELFDNDADTAATSLSRQPQLPFGARVRVTNVANGQSLVVRINDRGTYAWSPQEPKCLDLTDSAFSRLAGRLDPDDGHIVVVEEVLD